MRRDLLRVAEILDKSGHYGLSDKLFKVSQYMNQQYMNPEYMQQSLNRMRQVNNVTRELTNQLKSLSDARKSGQISNEEYVQRSFENLDMMEQNTYEVAEVYNQPVSQESLQAIYDHKQFLNNLSNQNNQGNYNQGNQAYNQGQNNQGYLNNQGYNQGYQNNQNYNQGYGASNMPQNLSGTMVMDGSQYLNNPYTPKGVMDIRKQLVPTNFRDEIARSQAGDNLVNSSDPNSFATSLFEFARRNNLNNGGLVKAFDAYADAGATYNGQSIKNIPQLRNLYMYIRNNNRMFTQTEIAQLLAQSFTR
jgi:hypothetical protein